MIGVSMTVCNNNRNQKATFEFDPNCDSVASVTSEMIPNLKLNGKSKWE